MDKIKIGKFLSLILRHQPESVGLSLDEHGWITVSKLINAVAKNSNFDLSEKLLDDIVETNNKKRYEYNEDKTKIRAVQGHSIKVDVELLEKSPPDVLYHGTVSKNLHSIKSQGLLPKSRLHVHLSQDINTAIKVGSRRGKAVILHINAKQMNIDNCRFYQAKNGVWLTDFVSYKYIKEL